MTRAEFLQGLRTELEGRVPYSVIQENIRYYDSYISDEISKGADVAEVSENLGGPRIIARTIVDAALNTEDRPDGYETYGSGETQEADDNSQSREYSGPYGTVDREESYHNLVRDTDVNLKLMEAKIPFLKDKNPFKAHSRLFLNFEYQVVKVNRI